MDVVTANKCRGKDRKKPTGCVCVYEEGIYAPRNMTSFVK